MVDFPRQGTGPNRFDQADEWREWTGTHDALGRSSAEFSTWRARAGQARE